MPHLSLSSNFKEENIPHQNNSNCKPKPQINDVDPMSKIIILDNSPPSYALQNENALPISSWYGSEKDTEL